MTLSDLNTLTAFLTALTQLDQPLPADIQTQLNEVGKTLAANPPSIGDLENIAKRYEPLKLLYQKEFAALLKAAGERDKGLEPLPLSNRPTQELTNAAIDTFSAEDSVTAAKNLTKPNILKQILQLIRGKN